MNWAKVLWGLLMIAPGIIRNIVAEWREERLETRRRKLFQSGEILRCRKCGHLTYTEILVEARNNQCPKCNAIDWEIVTDDR
ncbi:MAG: hypothetical protein Kow0090_08870 [Myxococcota bacterium]